MDILVWDAWDCCLHSIPTRSDRAAFPCSDVSWPDRPGRREPAVHLQPLLDSMGSLGPGAALEARMRREARRSRSLLQNAHLSLAEYRTNTKDQQQEQREHKVNAVNRASEPIVSSG